MKDGLGSWLLAGAWTGAALALVFCSASAGEGIRRGLAVCASVMIPSLYPFLILSDFVARTRLGQMLERPLGVVAERVYRCPRALAPAILMSWIGGYPAGARVLAGMAERGTLTREEAGRALAFCVNSGPAFLVAVVGTGVFGSPKWGLFLFACQLAAGVLTGRLLCRGYRWPRLEAGKERGCLPPAAGFVGAVTSATGGMLSICAFVLAFSALSQLFSDWGWLTAWGEGLSRLTGGMLTERGAACFLTGLLEIGGGCALAQGLPPGQGALALPFLLSFSSLSVMGQLAACFGEAGVDGGLLVRGRVVHGVLTLALAGPVLWGRFAAAPAMMAGRPVLAPGSGGLLGALGVMAMVMILCVAVDAGSDSRHKLR